MKLISHLIYNLNEDKLFPISPAFRILEIQSESTEGLIH